MQRNKYIDRIRYAVGELRKGREPQAIVGSIVTKYKVRSRVAYYDIDSAKAIIATIARVDMDNAPPEITKRDELVITLEDMLLLPISNKLDAITIQTRLAVIKELNAMQGYYFKDYNTANSDNATDTDAPTIV